MRVLIVGGTGFIGSHLGAALQRSGHCVRLLTRNSSSQLLNQYDEVFRGDLLDIESVNSAMEGVDVCVHAATTTVPSTSEANVEFDISTNLIGSIHLMRAASKAEVRRIVFLSSGGTVYGRTSVDTIPEDHPTQPISSYGIVKLTTEKYLHSFYCTHGLDYRVARLSNPYGPGQSLDRKQGIVPIFIDRILRGQDIEVYGDGSVVRDYVYIDDAIEGLLRLVTAEEAEHKIYNIGSGLGASINDVIDLVSDALGMEAKKVVRPARTFDVSRNVLDCSRAADDIGWKAAIPFKDGIDRTTQWYRHLSA